MTNISFNKEDHIEYEPFNLILRSIEAPDGLSEKVLEAMTQKRKEIEEIQHVKLSLRQKKQEKKAAHKSVAIRAAVIAAVITLMILIIPSSMQVVVSAAESAWNAFHSWVDDVFHVGLKQTKNGCTVEIVEARVANDFLYLKVKSDDYYYLYFDGSLSDNKGNEFPLISDYYVVDTESYTTEYYQIYIPELNERFSENNRYNCNLNVKVFPVNDSDVDTINDVGYRTYRSLRLENTSPICKMKFKLRLENNYSVVNSCEYDVDYSIESGDLHFDFKKLMITNVEASFLIEVSPVKPNKELIEYRPYVKAIMTDNENDGKIYTFDRITSVFRYQSKYYMILSNNNYTRPNFSVYYKPPFHFEIIEASYEKIRQINPNAEFHEVEDVEIPIRYDADQKIVVKKMPSFSIDGYSFSMTDFYKSEEIVSEETYCCFDFNITPPKKNKIRNKNKDIYEFGSYYPFSDNNYTFGELVLSAQSDGKEIFRLYPEIVYTVPILNSDEKETGIYETTAGLNDEIYLSKIKWSSAKNTSRFKDSEESMTLHQLCKQYNIDCFRFVSLALFEETVDKTIETKNKAVVEKYLRSGDIIGGQYTDDDDKICYTIYKNAKYKALCFFDHALLNQSFVIERNHLNNNTLHFTLVNPYYEEYDGTPIKHLFSFEYLPDRNNYEFTID